ncbi:unnamed protein product [Arabis nemorensis]|uniref:Uncharacterized protein n=1 Tax=Arabis nemorensis TaxID=586526 RepID=A0A565AY27_9BRAS|nr:unnamed protein product [Arabis nemorensis]
MVQMTLGGDADDRKGMMHAGDDPDDRGRIMQMTSRGNNADDPEKLQLRRAPERASTIKKIITVPKFAKARFLDCAHCAFAQ